MSTRLNLVSIFTLGLIIGLALGYLGRPLVAPPSQLAIAPTATLTMGFPPDGKPSPFPGPSRAEPLWDSAEGLVARVRHFKGDPQAPVVMIEFGDFQCPFCGQFARATAPLIEEAYIRPGKVRFGYLHFAFLGPESVWAAQASECAAEQEAFWAYHDLLFARQAGENRGGLQPGESGSVGRGIGAGCRCVRLVSALGPVRRCRCCGFLPGESNGSLRHADLLDQWGEAGRCTAL